MLKTVESIIFFVNDIRVAANWYADLFAIAHDRIEYENANYAFIRTPGVLIGFHPADSKCPGGIGGTTSYWSVDDLDAACEHMIANGARLYRGPMRTNVGDYVCMLIDPFGNSIGLHQANLGATNAAIS
ncbi:MAG: VOC family protein [Casimicrobium sp.]